MIAPFGKGPFPAIRNPENLMATRLGAIKLGEGASKSENNDFASRYQAPVLVGQLHL
tara:strand:+ start:321 stop:491 length:171 start_codon:yes stop_codon:yes gene_type:complete